MRRRKTVASPHRSYPNRRNHVQPRTNEQMAEHLLAHRNITDAGCWEWTGLLSKSGYGKIKWNSRHLRVHRVAAMLWLNFNLLNTKVVCHHCDNRRCFNPAHLFIGTNKDNQLDSVAKGRHWLAKKTHCKHGHEFTSANTWREKSGYRHCRKCHLENVLKHYHAKKKGRAA